MRFNQMMTAATLALLCASGATAVPDTFLYVGDLQEDGAPADGNFSVTFQMFNERIAGTKVFEESVVSLPVIGGVMVHELGTAPSNALDDAELAAGELFLAVVVNGTVLEPRVAIRSVPFASRAADSETLGGLDPSEFVTDDRIAAGDVLIDSANIADGSILSADIAAGAVTANNIAVGTITGDRIIAGGVGFSNLKDFKTLVNRPLGCGGGVDVATELFNYQCRRVLDCNATGQNLDYTTGICNTTATTDCTVSIVNVRAGFVVGPNF